MERASTVTAPERDLGNEDRRRGIVFFLVIAFGLAWLPFLPALVGGPAMPVLMPFAPAIAAVAVRKWVTREGFGDAGLRPGLRHWPLYLVAALWPLAVIPVRALSALGLGAAPAGFGFPWGVAAPAPSDVLLWSLASLALMPIFLGEEFGWRGYLQVRLLAGSPLRAAVATGLIWGVWHAPLILAGGEPTADRLQTLLVFPVFGVYFSVFLGWLRRRSGSVWPASAAHAANNITALNLTSLAFAGHVGATLDASWTLPTVLAEAAVLIGIVAAYELPRYLRRGQHAGRVRQEPLGAVACATNARMGRALPQAATPGHRGGGTSPGAEAEGAPIVSPSTVLATAAPGGVAAPGCLHA